MKEINEIRLVCVQDFNLCINKEPVLQVTYLEKGTTRALLTKRRNVDPVLVNETYSGKLRYCCAMVEELSDDSECSLYGLTVILRKYDYLYKRNRD